MEIPGYKIQHRVGQGGMATVYLATQESLNRSVVLKILDVNGPLASETLIERFLSEGRIVATLNHPCIITIYDIGIANDSLYISMEYIEGGDLKTRMELPITPDDALDFIAKIGSGLDAAHKMGVVHRDIKPGNIMFRDPDTPLITDFGIAKQTDAIDNDLTATGLFLGSPNYVSPEQADGIEIDGRADIYSLGCMFYEMLSGKKPYAAATVFDVIIQHKQAPVPVFEEGLEEFQPLLNKMMAKNREQRFEDAATMVESINKLQRKRKSSPTIIDFDTSGVIPPDRTEQKSTQILNILLLLLMTSGGIFGTLQYAESRMNDDTSRLDKVPTTFVMPETIPSAQVADDVSDPAKARIKMSEDVMQALHWLGKKSLEEYRLTQPPEDNAYYYFSRLLEADPTDKVATAGLLNIADRYAYLGERSVLDGDHDKAHAYIMIGRKFNPNHEALIKLNELNLGVGEKSFMEKLKIFFTGD
ncbi:MAG: serine/threonine protein kinase [Proteobacteria bacterium]|nr:serine/threonine protein kinase [Pseudomonadota bacterium]